MNDILKNQAFTSYPLFFDDVRKHLTFGDRSKTGAYIPLRQGVELLGDGKLRFNYRPPEGTKQVVIRGFGGSMPNIYELQPDTDGYWSLEVDDIRDGFHYFRCYVDGVQAPNYLAPYSYGCSQVLNFFEMPGGADPEFYLLKDVPHGTVRMDLYQSALTGRYRNCFIYTPPGYETDLDRKYPVFYLQHGGGENVVNWVWHGKINYICDNLIAEGKMEPMIIVMNNGYAFLKNEDGEYENRIDDVIVQDCVPFIDGKYRTIADRHGRAMAGLSMGGMQSNMTVMKNPDVFANLGVFSGGFRTEGEGYDCNDIFADPAKFHERFDLLFVSAGEDEPMCEVIRERLDELRGNGIDTVFYSCPGFHEWDTWRYAAREFLLRVFK